MVNRLRDVVRYLDLAAYGSAAFILVYGLLKSGGTFAPSTGSLIRAVHEPLPQAGLYALLLVAIVRMAAHRLLRGRTAGFLLQAGVLLMAAGLVISSLVRFEGKVILTEGQQFSGAAEEYIKDSLYMGKMSAFPRIKLEVREVAPDITKSGSAERITIRMISQINDFPAIDMPISSPIPAWRRGLLFRTERFGYSPLFRFTEASGAVLDEFFWALGVFPPGAEDALRTWWIPHIFYVRYFPAGFTPEQQDHEFLLRIVRNIDVLYQGRMRLHDTVKFDGMAVSFENVKKWAEISVVKDYGLLVFYAGCLFFTSGFALHVRQAGKQER